jgi:cytochrome d ubiquinol oxidase subunit I
MRASLRFGLFMAVAAGIGTTITGDMQGKVMTEVQPMKMAAAEALWDSKSDASFSLFTVGTRDAKREVFSVRVPYLLSYLADGDIHAEVEGLNDLQAEYAQRFGPGDYTPYVPTTYWSFRYMIGLGGVTTALALLGIWLTRRGRLPGNRWFWRAFIWTTPLAILANSFGWIFTEMGRQPWAVFGEMLTRDALSPSVPAWQVITSLVVFAVLYVVIATIALRLLIRYAQAGPPPDAPAPSPEAQTPTPQLTFAY